ncbi:helix-turn-helix domain-containing protein [bacterium]|nr:helix-turn-helix domain-containing protein [bacterium]MCI0606536.1 helix-turn-helix domain-containing protein [bacterium]
MEMIANAEAYFIGELYNAASDDLVVYDAMKRIIAAKGTVNLHRLATRYGLTSRRIQQRFSDFAGCTPKMFARLAKFRFALYKLHTISNVSLTDVAYTSGYL